MSWLGTMLTGAFKTSPKMPRQGCMRPLFAVLVLALTMSACGGESTLRGTADRIPVILVTEPIPAGTSVSQAVKAGALEMRLAERQFVPDGAPAKFDDLQGVSLEDLPMNTLVAAGMFG